ncbi:unnamed protein product [Brassica oleracea]
MLIKQRRLSAARRQPGSPIPLFHQMNMLTSPPQGRVQVLQKVANEPHLLLPTATHHLASSPSTEIMHSQIWPSQSLHSRLD